MSLEDKIKQEAFPNEREKVLVNILYTHSHLVNKLDQLFNTYEITRQQYNVLRILRGQHPESISLNNIKDRMIEKVSDTTRIVEQLRTKGLIVSNERQSSILINLVGFRLLDKLDQIITNFELENIQLNQEEARIINKLLDKLRRDKY